MAYVKKDDARLEEGQKVRIAITSRNAKAVENVTTNFLIRSHEKDVKTRGPVRLPTRTLRLTTRKSPCGNGTNTWDTFEMKIYKRVLYLTAPIEVVKEITSFKVDAGVDVVITILEKQ